MDSQPMSHMASEDILLRLRNKNTSLSSSFLPAHLMKSYPVYDLYMYK